ncbi:MAG TPA: hypothetical protein VII47_13165, partial [Actinomycetota bacterium]
MAKTRAEPSCHTRIVPERSAQNSRLSGATASAVGKVAAMDAGGAGWGPTVQGLAGGGAAAGALGEAARAGDGLGAGLVGLTAALGEGGGTAPAAVALGLADGAAGGPGLARPEVGPPRHAASRAVVTSA